MKAIGGYFELELNHLGELHSNALNLNTGRNAFEYILRVRHYQKIYIPYFTCEVILQPLIRLKIDFEYYHINETFEPIFDFELMKSNEAFLYTNYFGINDLNVSTIAKKCKNVIIDNSQSFFSKPIEGTDTFYSARKFFGVPDGAYLYCNSPETLILEEDYSFERMIHLTKRIDMSAEDGYQNFCKNESDLANNTLKKMSKLTQKILTNIDYVGIAKKRIENFEYLNYTLSKVNELKVDLSNNQVPLSYPFLFNQKKDLYSILLNKKIYTSKYWSGVTEKVEEVSVEFNFTENLIHLPIDQRINKENLDLILQLIHLK